MTCDSAAYPGGPPCESTAVAEIVGIKEGPLGDEGETIAIRCGYHAGTFMAAVRDMGRGFHGYKRVEAFDL